MNERIAVEENLTPVKDFLSNKGYQVESIDLGGKPLTNQADSYDAFVVTGLDSNVMGIQDTLSKSIVINAKGLTAEQVYDELKKRLI